MSILISSNPFPVNFSDLGDDLEKWGLLETLEFTNVAQVDSSVDLSDYKRFRIVGNITYPSGNDLSLRMNDLDTTIYSYRSVLSTTWSIQSSARQIQILTTAKVLDIVVTNPDDSIAYVGPNNGGYSNRQMIGGNGSLGSAISKFNFLNASGTISGTIKIYGEPEYD
jgi:hypothetical protein